MRGGVAVLAALCVLWAAEADELDDTLQVFNGADRGARTKSVTTSALKATTFKCQFHTARPPLTAHSTHALDHTTTLLHTGS